MAGHGADPLTSLGLHLFPELMRKDLIPDGQPLKKRSRCSTCSSPGWARASFEGAEVAMPNEYDEVYNLGVAKGDPKLCSAETGAALYREAHRGLRPFRGPFRLQGRRPALHPLISLRRRMGLQRRRAMTSQWVLATTLRPPRMRP